MTTLPPPRYRVVEQGRRLVVIDRWSDGARPDTGPAAGPAAADAPAASLLGRARQTRFDGGAELTTHPFYDANGPRTVRLDAGSAQLLRVARGVGIAAALAIAVAVGLQPWLLVPAAFGVFKARRPLRSRITAWLDTVQREAG